MLTCCCDYDVFGIHYFLTQGPRPSAIVVGRVDDDTLLLVVSNGNVGGLYYFTVDTRDALPNPVFQGFIRRGNPGLSWDEAYRRNDDSVGEADVQTIK